MPVSSGSAYSVAEQPEQAIDFNTFYRQNNFTGADIDPNNILSKIGNFFVGDVDSAKKQYEAYLSNLNIRNEAKATQSARAWEEYMDSTRYQRAFNDLKAAGINPYMLVNNGAAPAAGSSSSPKASYSKPGVEKSESKVQARDFALILLALARIAAL